MNKNIDKIQSQSINSFKYKIFQYMVKIQFFKNIYNIFLNYYLIIISPYIIWEIILIIFSIHIDKIEKNLEIKL